MWALKSATSREQPPGGPRKSRRLCLVPGHLVTALFVVDVGLLLADYFHKLPKGYAAMIAVALAATAVFCVLLWWADSVLYRRRFQFSLRSLMLFTAVVAISFSWLANEMRYASKQRQVLARILETKCYVNYRKRRIPLPVGSFSYPVNKLGLVCFWPRRWLGDDFFVSVDYVYLTTPGVTKSLLSDLAGLRDLRTLTLEQTEITDDGMEALAGLRQLTDLSIHDSSITDAGLKHLQGLTRLRKLKIECPRVGDHGLEHLKGLASLRELWLFDTRVTEAGEKSIRRALANCSVGLFPAQGGTKGNKGEGKQGDSHQVQVK